MKSLGLRIVAATCVLLSVGVIANVVFLQRGAGTRDLSSPATNAAAIGQVTLPGRKLVQAIQRELGDKGYLPGRADGRLDVLTRAAILAFETDNKLPQTAEPSDQLLQSLLLGPTVEVVAEGQPPGAEVVKLVREVQHLLLKRGCGKLEKSGVLDRQTRQAIAHCQRGFALPADGRISAALVAKLRA